MKYLHLFLITVLLLTLSSFLITSNFLSGRQIKEHSFMALDESITEEMLVCAGEFKVALTNNGAKRASVYVYNNLSVRNYPGKEGAEKLAERIVMLGFTDVYLAVHPVNGQANSELKDKAWIQSFISFLRLYNIDVHALMFSDAAQFNPANDTYIYNHASIIQHYNQTVNENERFSGAAADWEPHSLTINNYLSGAGNEDEEGANLASEDRWANSRYEKGGANDRLLKRTGEMLAYAKKSLNTLSESYQLPQLTFCEAINYHVQEQFDKGNLTYGNVTNYLTSDRCDDVNVMAYNHQKEEIWRRAEFILNAADKNNLLNSVYIGIKTRLGDDEGPVTSLKPKGWDYLIETLQYLHKQAAPYISMKGITVYEFSDMEEMWLAASQSIAATGTGNVINDMSITQTADAIHINKPVKQILLYNLSGSLVKRVENTGQLSFGEVADGIYIVWITTEDNQNKTIKILKR